MGGVPILIWLGWTVTEKYTPGQIWHPPKAADHNLIADSAEDYRSRILGLGGNPAKIPVIPTDIIKVKNSSGSHRRLGEALEVDIRGLLVSDVEARSLWIDADIPSDLVRWGILKKALPNGEIGELQISGVCKAIVDIQSTSDTRAGPVASSAVLESGTSGPLKLLYAPASTGEQECIVQFDAETAALPKGFFYDGGELTLTVDAGLGDMIFDSVEYPTGGSGGSVSYNASTGEFTLNDDTQWMMHLTTRAYYNLSLSTGENVTFWAWISYYYGGAWVTNGLIGRTATYQTSSSITVGELATFHHVLIPSVRMTAGMKIKVICQADHYKLLGAAGSMNADFDGVIHWHQIKDPG